MTAGTVENVASCPPPSLSSLKPHMPSIYYPTHQLSSLFPYMTLPSLTLSPSLSLSLSLSLLHLSLSFPFSLFPLFFRSVCSQLDGDVYSSPLPTNDFYGNPTLKRGKLTWAQGATPGPIAGTIPWRLLLQIPLLNFVSMQSNALYGPALPANIDRLPFLQTM